MSGMMHGGPAGGKTDSQHCVENQVTLDPKLGKLGGSLQPQKLQIHQRCPVLQS